MKKILILILILPTIMSCAQSTKDIPSIKNFDSERFLGQWYEIARLDHSFERGLSDVTANYSIKDNGKIKVLNQGIKEDGTSTSTEGKAYVKKTDDNLGELRVSFFWIFYAKYRIIYLDENYETAVVTSSSRKYLWILSRNPYMEETKLNELLAFCNNHGFDTENLIYPQKVKQ